MGFRIANAPCSWGVDFADNPRNPPWSRMLDEVAAAGYSAVDLGPVGYLPTDPGRLADELASRGLTLSAGGLFDPLADASAFSAVLEKTRKTCEILRALNASRLVIIDHVSDRRGATAGRSEASPRLEASEWKAMIGRIRQLAEIAFNDYGIASTLHPHAGCYIEYQDEIDMAMQDLPEALVGLCVDTGHAAYAGQDPVALIKQYAGRLNHMHFKNIDPVVHARCLSDGAGFFEAVKRGIFCPLGAGVVDFTLVSDALRSVNYNGLAVVEQDIDPSDAGAAVANARQSYAFLRTVNLVH